MINSVSFCYFVLSKKDINPSDLDVVRNNTYSLGYTTLIDNKYILFCKNVNTQLHYNEVKKHYIELFGIEPDAVYDDLQQFFEDNDL